MHDKTGEKGKEYGTRGGAYAKRERIIVAIEELRTVVACYSLEELAHKNEWRPLPMMAKEMIAAIYRDFARELEQD